MIAYTYNYEISSDDLHAEIMSSGLAGFMGLSSTPTSVDVLFSSEITPTEKTTLDALITDHVNVTMLGVYKHKKNMEIDKKTSELISQGFTYGGKQFSLSLTAQNNWQGIKNDKDWQPYPFGVTTKDDEEFIFNTATEVFDFYTTGKSVVAGHYNSGRALKLQVNAATDKAGVDAVVDNR